MGLRNFNTEQGNFYVSIMLIYLSTIFYVLLKQFLACMTFVTGEKNPMNSSASSQPAILAKNIARYKAMYSNIKVYNCLKLKPSNSFDPEGKRKLNL